MNHVLTSRFDEWEVLKALKQMAPMKALGPDGMPLLFFQHFWPMIESDVTHLVLSWLNSEIAFSFVGLTLKNAAKFWSCYLCMKKSLAKN